MKAGDRYKHFKTKGTYTILCLSKGVNKSGVRGLGIRWRAKYHDDPERIIDIYEGNVHLISQAEHTDGLVIYVAEGGEPWAREVKNFCEVIDGRPRFQLLT